MSIATLGYKNDGAGVEPATSKSARAEVKLSVFSTRLGGLA